MLSNKSTGQETIAFINKMRADVDELKRLMSASPVSTAIQGRNNRKIAAPFGWVVPGLPRTSPLPWRTGDPKPAPAEAATANESPARKMNVIK